MRIWILLQSVFFGFFATAGAALAQQPPVEIKIVDMSFVPAMAVVEVGQVVRWTNTTAMSHSVTLDPALAADAANIVFPEGAETFHSGRLLPGAVFERTFTVPGRYRYICKPHEAMGHIAELVVVPPAALGTKTVLIPGMVFDPAHIEIVAGETIRWINTSKMSHTVTADETLVEDARHVFRPNGAQVFSSERIQPGQIFEHKFDVVGDYGYACKPHEMMGHLGTVRVVPAPL